MHSLLADIVAAKEREVQGLKKKANPFLSIPDLPSRRDFEKTVSRPGGINLIAEIKFASPSAGIIHKRIDPCAIGRIYEKAGAQAISLLTDKRFFGGDLKELPILKKAVSLPLLRKDFIIDEIQIEESQRAGADAVLIIAHLLSEKKLKTLLRLSRNLGLDTLTEIHDQEDLEKALKCGARVIGINNRNLNTFQVDFQTTLDLAPHIPQGCIKVSESGIRNEEDFDLLRESGIQAVLIGTSIMKSPDIAGKVGELVKARIKEEGCNKP